MSVRFLDQINSQQELSNGVISTLLPFMLENYYPGKTPDQIVCGDLGSFARGTNNDISPDLDIGFFGASNEEAEGYKDWTPIGTHDLTGNKLGITSLKALSKHDPLVLKTIQLVKPSLDTYFSVPQGSTHFNWMRSWIGYPGWVCNLSLPHTIFGTIEIDLNLGYTPNHYGIEHAKRFNRYFNQVLSDLGTTRAVQLIKDIRLVKKQGKTNAINSQGWVERSQKLAGFVVEILFMHQFPPHTYAELMELILNHEWESGREPSNHMIGDQTDQIIDGGFGFPETLSNLALENQALPMGAWKNLQKIAYKSR